MQRIFSARIFAVTLACLALAACERVPYIHNANEFNRADANFGKELTDRAALEICYAKQTTTPVALLTMADLECGRFGKRAVFIGQDILICPILTPARAKFQCVAE